MIRRSDDGTKLHGERIRELEVKVEIILWWTKALAGAVITLAGALVLEMIKARPL
jgi:hypothetical protein